MVMIFSQFILKSLDGRNKARFKSPKSIVLQRNVTLASHIPFQSPQAFKRNETEFTKFSVSRLDLLNRSLNFEHVCHAFVTLPQSFISDTLVGHKCLSDRWELM
jgi:hypothetical protein